MISPEMLEIYKIGVQYHLIHAVVLLVPIAIGTLSGKEFLNQSFIFFAVGIFLFSFPPCIGQIHFTLMQSAA